MASVLDWLLLQDTPGIRCRTLQELLDTPPDAPEVVDAYALMWASKDIQKMLARRTAEGIWAHTEQEYGVHTSLRYLTAFAENGAQRDERLDGATAYAVSFLQEKASANLAHDYSGCSNALVLRALVMLGYHEDMGVRALLEAYATAQLYDGGFMCRRLLAKRPGRKSCYKASAAGLLLYAECHRRGIDLLGTDELLTYFLKRDVFYASDDREKLLLDGKPGWRSIDNFFPPETMRIGLTPIIAALAVLGVGSEPALGRAWRLLEAKADPEGRYPLEGTLTKQPCGFGRVGEPNKWVTFYALLAQKHRVSR